MSQIEPVRLDEDEEELSCGEEPDKIKDDVKEKRVKDLQYPLYYQIPCV